MQKSLQELVLLDHPVKYIVAVTLPYLWLEPCDQGHT